jgi:hypothetical protein
MTPKEIIKKAEFIFNKLTELNNFFLDNENSLDLNNLFKGYDMNVSSIYLNENIKNEIYFFFGKKVLIYNIDKDTLNEEDNILSKYLFKRLYKTTDKIDASLKKFKDNFNNKNILHYFNIKKELLDKYDEIKNLVEDYNNINGRFGSGCNFYNGETIQDFNPEDLEYYNNQTVFNRTITTSHNMKTFYRLICNSIELLNETNLFYKLKFKLDDNPNNYFDVKTIHYEDGSYPKTYGHCCDIDTKNFFFKNVRKKFICISKKKIDLDNEICITKRNQLFDFLIKYN